MIEHNGIRYSLVPGGGCVACDLNRDVADGLPPVAVCQMCASMAAAKGLEHTCMREEEQKCIPTTGAEKADAGKCDLSFIPCDVLRRHIQELVSETPEPNDRQGRDTMYFVGEAATCLAQFLATGDDDLLEQAFDELVSSFDNGWDEAAYWLSRAMAFGAQKYARNNWRKGFPDSRLAAASLRHLIGSYTPATGFLGGYLTGVALDHESGEDHRGHALFGISVLLDQRAGGRGVRDLGK